MAFRDRVEQLKASGVFLGGPPKLFETAGRKTLITLVALGLTPESRVLDVGCGSLRIGYWLIHFLLPQHYFGIEPNVPMLEAGKQFLLDPEVLAYKAPRFDHNTEFDFRVFDTKFDFVVARSIWTHASKPQIEKMLDEFVATATQRGIFLTSYKPPHLLRRDYQGNVWVGRDHISTQGGAVRHSFRWIREQCAQRNLAVEEIKGSAYNFGGQRWLKIRFKNSRN
ncbi:MAG: class I SAM-dependent methyltransferase [Chloroflexi bacterium]|nr:class I SAM-dependent methyltransferase [Chloroflexota bacterium]